MTQPTVERLACEDGHGCLRLGLQSPTEPSTGCYTLPQALENSPRAAL